MARAHISENDLTKLHNDAARARIKAKFDDFDHAADKIDEGGTTNTSQIHHVRAASTTNVADLTACSTTMDTSVTLVAGDRVLLKDQTNAAQNGIYDVGTVATGTAPLTRSADWNEAAEIKQGTLVHVAEGTANANLFYEITADFPATVGTSHQHFTGIWTTSAVLSADDPGRALMATGYFSEATATDKFAAQAITGALLKNATVTATQLGAGAVTQAKLATVLCAAPTTRSGPGAVAITAPTCLVTSTGTGDALTIVDSTVAGHRLRIVHIADGGTAVITQTTGAKLTAAISTITFTNVYDWVELEWSGSLWNVIGYGGVTIA